MTDADPGLPDPIRGSRGRATALAVWAAWAVLVAASLTYVVAGGNPYPWSDEWNVLPFATGDRDPSLSWLWAQHNEHRIPLPKAVWVASLRITRYDYRGCLVANAAAVALATAILLLALQRTRARASLWDVGVLLLVFNPGFGTFRWGFSFQFVASTSLSLAAAGALAITLHGGASAGRAWPLVVGFCVAALPLCGVNGLLAGSAFATGILLLLWKRRDAVPSRDRILLRAAALASLAIATVSLVQFKGGPAMGGPSLQWGNVGHWVLHLLVSPFVIWAPQALGVKLGILGSAALVGAVGLLRAARQPADLDRGRVSRTVGLGLAAGGSLANVVAIAFGRGGHSAWDVGTSMHYGLLVVPLAAFLFESAGEGGCGRLGSVVRGLLLAAIATSFLHLVGWAGRHAGNLESSLKAVGEDIRAGASVDDLVAEHIGFFFFADTPETRGMVRDGLPVFLRAREQRGAASGQGSRAAAVGSAAPQSATPPRERPLPASAYLAEIVPGPLPATCRRGAKAAVAVSVTNRSPFGWPASSATFALNFSYHWKDRNGRVVVFDGARTPIPGPVGAGRTVTFPAEVVFPREAGTYTLEFDLVEEWVAWFADKGSRTAVIRVEVEAGQAEAPRAGESP